MRDRRVAARYARALLQAARSEADLAALAESYAGVAQVMRDHPALPAFLEGPQVAEDEKKQLLESLLGGRVEPLLLRFFHLLIDKNRIEHLCAIGEEFALQVEAEQGYRRAVVVTAVPLPGDLEEALRARLAALASAKIILEKKVDPGVIGGACVTMGDQILDGTVRTNLMRLRDRLLQAPLRLEPGR